MGKNKRIKALRKEAERNKLAEELINVKPSNKIFSKLNVKMRKTMGVQVFLLVFSTIILLLYSFMLLFNTAAVLRVISENTEQAAKYLLTESDGKIIPVNDMVELESYEVAADGQINAVGKDGADYISRAEIVIVEDTAGRTFFDKTEGVVITEATSDFAVNLLQGVSYGWVLAYAVLFGLIMIYGYKNNWLIYDRKLPIILYFVIIFGFLLFKVGLFYSLAVGVDMDFNKNNEEIVETGLIEFDEEDLDSIEEIPPQVDVNSGNNGNNGLSLEEQVREMSDKLISTVLGENDECKSLRKLLFNAFKPDIFKDENYVIYKVLYSFKDKDFLPDAEFMRMYLLRNEWVMREAGSKINFNAYSEVDENPAIGYIMGVIKQYNRLSKEKNLDLNEFKLILEKYKMGFQSFAIEEVLDRGKLIITEGLTENRKHLQGYEDSKLYIKTKTAQIDALIEVNEGEGFIDGSTAGLIDDEEAMPELIGDFGAVKELNKYAGGITTKTFYSVLAPTKAGKSKFTTRMLHNVMVEHGHPVVVWPFEGGAADWFAQLRSIHFDYLYNKDAETSKQILGVSQQMIREKKWKSEEIRQLEDASRVDLFTNPKYGKVIVIDRPFKVETLESELDTAVNTYGAKAVLIDYLQLIGWEDARMSKVQAIGKAYQTMLRYTRTRGVAAISPAQCTQEFISECAKSKDGAVKELRTAGAESSEVVRTPDVNIALYSSTDDLINNSMKIMSIPSRYMSAFPAFEIYCDLSRSLFASLD